MSLSAARISDDARIEELEREIRKLRRINEALMDRVERSTDLQGGAFSLFQTAITLEERVRSRTRELDEAMRALSFSNADLSRAKEDAEVAQSRLRDAIESINEGFALFDTDDRLVLCNETYRGLWPTIADRIVPGLTFQAIAELIAAEGITLSAMVTPDRWLSDRIAQHAVADGAHVHALADGRWIQINELSTFEGGIVGVYTDITDVKVADARVRARELAEKSVLLQATLDAIPQGVAVYDANRQLTVWNRTFRSLLSLPDTVVAQAAPHDLLLAFNRERGTGGMAEAVLAWSASSHADAVEQPWADKTYEVRRAAMPDGGLVLTFADVTERRRFIEALRDGEARLRLVAEGMPAGIAYLDDHQRYQFANRNYVATFGGGRDTVTGMTVRELLGGAAYAIRRPHIATVLGGATSGFEITLDGPGEPRTMAAAYTPHRDEEGVVRGWFALIQDVTDQRSIARALEQRVAERTAELSGANAALSEAKHLAETANVSKTRFLAAASHDLLQPLNAARLFVTALAERRLATDSRALVDRIESALLSVEDLLESLLEISVLDAAAVEPQRTDFAIQPLLANLLAEFAPVARSHGLELGIVRCSAFVNSDPRLLRRILQNFILNALRYSTGTRVLVGCRRTGTNLRIEIIDTGPGIPADKHRLIFDEFARLDGDARGIGLGLAIVDRAARILGHEVTLRSAPGVGSTFGVTVPMVFRGTASIAENGVTALRRSPIDGVRILVVDNERSVLDGMSALLGGWSCDVAAAIDEAAALAHLDGGFEPDLVIADHHLNEGRFGSEAIAAIYTHLGYAVPALIITADRTPELHDVLVAEGFAVQTKPVKPAQLRALITRLIETG